MVYAWSVGILEIFFCRTHSHVLFWGHWYPCLGFLVTSSLGFKARVASALFAFCGSECNVNSLTSTSGATLCQPLDSQHCGVFISCPRILLAPVRLKHGEF